MSNAAGKEPMKATPVSGAPPVPPAKGPAKALKPKTSRKEKAKTAIIVVLVVILVLEGVFLVIFKVGFSDLVNDQNYFVALQTDGVFKAGTYWRKSDEHKITYDVEKLGAYTPQYTQQNYNTLSGDQTNAHGPLDRMVVWSSQAIRELYGSRTVNFEFEDLTVDQLLDYINFQTPPDRYFHGNETIQDVRARMFNAWIDQYFGNTVNTFSELPRVLAKVREGKIDIYPDNAAVTLLKFLPLEGLIF